MSERDDARTRWAASGLTYEDLTTANLQALRTDINEAMVASGAVKNTLRAHQRFKTRNTQSGFEADLRCRAFYFDDRQAVTFEPSGFIGFAGWADDKNVAPILVGFERWIDRISATAIAA